MFTGSKCVFNAPNPIREGNHLQVTVSGPPGEQAFVYLSKSSGFSFKPAWKGVWFNAPPILRRLHLGVIPASGSLAAQIVVPDMGAGFTNTTWFLQALRLDSGGNVTLGSLVSLSILDSIY